MSKRSDVLLSLGEPRYRLEGDRFLMYEWDVAYGYLLIGGPGAGAALPLAAPHFLCFEFGKDARLVRKFTLSGAIYDKHDNAIKKCTHSSEAGDGADGD